MNTDIITETARKTLDGTMSFPEVVGQLFSAGVEYYHVDYVGLKKTFYGADGDMVVTPINYEGLPAVAPEFSLEGIRADILDSQRNGQRYRDFTRRAMESGVQGYFAFLRGKRVTYLGRQGDQHTEWFPARSRFRTDDQGDAAAGTCRRCCLEVDPDSGRNGLLEQVEVNPALPHVLAERPRVSWSSLGGDPIARTGATQGLDA